MDVDNNGVLSIAEPVKRGRIVETHRWRVDNRALAFQLVELLIDNGAAVRMTQAAGQFLIVGLRIDATL